MIWLSTVHGCNSSTNLFYFHFFKKKKKCVQIFCTLDNWKNMDATFEYTAHKRMFVSTSVCVYVCVRARGRGQLQHTVPDH